MKEGEKKPKLKKNKLWNLKVAMSSIVIGALGTVTKGLVQRTGGLGNKRTSRDHPNYGMIAIGQNTWEEFWRLAVTQSPVENYMLWLAWKILEREKQYYEQVVYSPPWICPGIFDAQSFLGFWDINRSTNLGQSTRPSDSQQKKVEGGTCRIMDFAVQSNHKIKIKIKRKER